MINKETVNLLSTGVSNNVFTMNEFIDKLFDSIGSCEKCEYSKVEERNYSSAVDDILICTRGGFDPIEPDFFCADFEPIGEE